MQSLTGIMNLVAENFAPRGQMFAQGQTLQIAEHTSLFSLIGTKFGGDGRTTFDLPKIDKVAGGVGYVINTRQELPPFNPVQDGFAGQVMLCPFDFAVRNWHFCDGTTLHSSLYPSLYAAIGTTYGGDAAQGTFNLPNIPAINTGQKEGSTVNYMICLEHEGTPSPYYADIVYSARPVAGLSHTWHDCNGAMLPISQYQYLYSLIGNTYGHEGDSFALPSLNGPIDHVNAVLALTGIYPIRS